MTFLHVEDNEGDRLLTEALISRTAHWSYQPAHSIRAGLNAWRQRKPEVVLMDLSFLGQHGQETYDAIREMAHSETIVIALSGDDTQGAVSRCRDAGAVAFIHKAALQNAQAFHDAIIEAIELALKLSTSAELAPIVARLELLSKAVLWGNGEPGLLERTAIVETKIDSMQKSMDGGFAQVRDNQDLLWQKVDDKNASDRYKAWLQFAGYVTLVLLAMLKLFQHDGAPVKLVPPMVEEDGR